MKAFIEKLLFSTLHTKSKQTLLFLCVCCLNGEENIHTHLWQLLCTIQCVCVCVCVCVREGETGTEKELVHGIQHPVKHTGLPQDKRLTADEQFQHKK